MDQVAGIAEMGGRLTESDVSMLRVGLLLGDTCQPAWAHEVVLQIRQSDRLELVGALVSEGGEEDVEYSGTGAATKWSLLVRRYLEWDRRRFPQGSGPLEPMDVGPLLQDIPSVSVATQPVTNDEAGSATDVASLVRGWAPDVLLDLGLSGASETLASQARYGVWRVQHGGAKDRGALPGFWEVVHQEPLTTFTLRARMPDSEHDTVLFESFSATDLDSVVGTGVHHFWKISRALVRSLDKLQSTGTIESLGCVHPSRRSAALHRAAQERIPSNIDMVGLWGAHFARRLRHRLHYRRTYPQWILLYAFGGKSLGSIRKFNRLVPPPDVWWADPFLLCEDGRQYVFVEEFASDTGKGHVSVMELHPDGSYEGPNKVLDLPHHLSYPFLLRWHGDLFMIPEAAASRSIAAYRCARFPDRWEYHTTLMKDIEAYDPTLVEFDGKWWLFVTVVERAGISPHEELFLYYADNPFSTDWTPHPCNPVVSDASRARPAGAIFEARDRLYRPSQDCTRRYGYGLRINEILTLNDTEFEEREVDFVEPNWDPALEGIHHLTRSGDLTICDAVLISKISG